MGFFFFTLPRLAPGRLLLKTHVEAQLGGQTLHIETGQFAPQADGSVTVRYGELTLLSTACMSDNPREGLDFFPLSCEFEEKTYAVGRIPGSVLRREARPPDTAILTARLTDRPLRPLFPKGMVNDVQIINTLLVSDEDNQPDVLAIVGASTALTVSRIPFNGPIGAVRVGLDGDGFVTNPSRTQMEEHPDLDLVVAASEEGIVMLEAGAKQVSDSVMFDAIQYGYNECQIVIKLQHELRDQIGVDKVDPVIRGVSEELVLKVDSVIGTKLRSAVMLRDDARAEAISIAREEAIDNLESPEIDSGDVKGAFDAVLKKHTRQAIVVEGVRPDGRKADELRALSADVGVLPRLHGSGLFQRGQTQSLNVVTLGSGRNEQRVGIDNLGLEPPKRFMHHYNMPPFASGEAYPMRGPRRREIGHGYLAERALRGVLPSQEDFPYTIRTVSEILSSNGSTSMAATTSCSLALMDAGVPILAPVTGISIGLVTADGHQPVLLTDIQGAEDHFGDMDFKVAGTRDGITAIQLDIKLTHISLEVVRGALSAGNGAREKILDVVEGALSASRPEVGEYAPKILRHAIDPSKIGEIIGPGGKVIRRLEEENEVEINIDEDGTVTVGSVKQDGAKRAIQMIRDIVGDIEIGRTIMGKVVRVLDFGAFVEIAPGKDGLVHISQLAEYRVNKVEDVVSVGDEIMVKITEVDDLGRINLSRRAVLEEHGVVPASAESKREGDGNYRDDQESPRRRDRRGGRGGRGGRRPARGGRDQGR